MWSPRSDHHESHVELQSVSKVCNDAEKSHAKEIGVTVSEFCSPIIDPGLNTNINQDKKPVQTEMESTPRKRLLYRLTETPPVHFLILFAIQHASLSIATPLTISAIVAEVVCAEEEESLRVQIISSTMLMIGISTFCMTTFGVRLPIFQGPMTAYIAPLFAMMSLPEFKCPETFEAVDPRTNETVLMARISNETVVRNYDVAIDRINAYSGSLMLAGGLHFLVGITGLIGIIGRYIGPVTIVPVVALFGIYMHTVAVRFAETNWTVAVITAGTCIFLGLFLEKRNTPIPVWTRSRGFHILWKPFHRLFALLIGFVLGWVISYIMTEFDALSDDPKSKEYKSRTDTRIDNVKDTDWFLHPYPGQFGTPSFSLGAFIAFMIGTLISLLDSIADYNATAKVAHVPFPPTYALNRGIAVEGLMSFISGALGCGHATASHGDTIGAMGITRVTSRSVFQLAGCIYIVFAILGKVGDFAITVPYAVIGGAQIITFGIFLGVILSYLQLIDLNSNRNVNIIGLSLFLGLMMPYWLSRNPGAIDTGIADLDNAITMCMNNPSFIGGVFAAVMDNVIPDTLQERGILMQLKEIGGDKTENGEDDQDDDSMKKNDAEENEYECGPEVYRLPWLPESFRKSCIARYIPIFDYVKKVK